MPLVERSVQGEQVADRLLGFVGFDALAAFAAVDLDEFLDDCGCDRHADISLPFGDRFRTASPSAPAETHDNDRTRI